MVLSWLLQLKVMRLDAFWGFQSDVVMVKSTVSFPSFQAYTVTWLVIPGDRVPQSIEYVSCVQFSSQ
jgi:hypothetical protein